MNGRKSIAFAMICLMMLSTIFCDAICVYGAEDKSIDEILTDREDEVIMSTDTDLIGIDDALDTDEGMLDDLIIASEDEDIQAVEALEDEINVKNDEAGSDEETFVVNSIDELVSKIGSNRTIILADGIYKTSKTIEVYKYDSNYNNIVISDMKIQAANPGKAEILLDDTMSGVFMLSNCKNVTIQGLILGHDPAGEYSECGGDGGDVIQIYNSDSVFIKNCDLYGCGWSAIELGDAGAISVDNCVLRDCTYNAVNYYTSEHYTNSFFMNLQMNNCVISGNTKKDMIEKYWYEYDKVALFDGSDWGLTGSRIACHDCMIINNKSKKLIPDGAGDSITFDSGCEFYNNVFDNQSTKQYGICVNGLTWQVTDSVLEIGFPLELSENDSIESNVTEVLSYSNSSLPWKEIEYDYYDVKDGVEYDKAVFEGKKPVTSINVSETELELSVGGSAMINATVYPADATDKTLTWTSDDERVAKVDSEGKVTAIAPGTTSIKATLPNGKYAACTVKVTEAQIIKGDLTGDGIIAMGDVVMAARAVAGNLILSERQKAAADLTGDGVVAMGDVVLLARFVAGTIKEL